MSAGGRQASDALTFLRASVRRSSARPLLRPGRARTRMDIALLSTQCGARWTSVIFVKPARRNFGPKMDSLPTSRAAAAWVSLKKFFGVPT